MQRKDSLGAIIKIPRLSTGTTRKIKTRRSQSTVSSISDVFADEATTKSHAGLSVCGMKLSSEKKLDGNQGRIGETGQASETLTDPFDKGEQTLIRPDYHHHADLKSQARILNGRKLKERRRSRSVPRSTREKNYCSGECPNQRLGVTSGEKNNHL